MMLIKLVKEKEMERLSKMNKINLFYDINKKKNFYNKNVKILNIISLN